MKNEFTKEFVLKSVDDENRSIEGFLSTYGNTDRHGDMIKQGAFSESIENQAVVPFLLNHSKSDILGTLTLEERSEGVYAVAKLFDNDKANDAYELAKAGALKSFSVGFVIDDWENDIELSKLPEADYIIKKARIFEGSIVFVPANDEAKVTQVKNKEDDMSKILELQKELDDKTKEIENLKSGETESNELIPQKNDELQSLEKQLDELTKSLEAANSTNENLKKGDQQMSQMYLKSRQSMDDLASVLIKSRGDDFEKAWKDHLLTKNIDGANLLFPDALVSAVQSNLQEEGKLLPFLRTISGVSVYRIINEELNTLGSGHNRKVEEKKQDTKIKFVSKTINSQFIYVFKQIEKELLKEDKKGILIDYIVNTLPKRLVVTIERAILIGDGLAEGDKYKITSYEPITAAEEYFKTDIKMDAGVKTEVLDAVEKAIKSGEFVLVMNRKTFVDFKNLRNTDKAKVYTVGTKEFGGRVYPTLDGTMIVENEYMSNDYNSADPIVIGLKIGAYVHITDATEFDFYRDFTLSTNKEEILVESYSGGALEQHQSAAVVWGKAKTIAEAKKAPEGDKTK